MRSFLTLVLLSFLFVSCSAQRETQRDAVRVPHVGADREVLSSAAPGAVTYDSGSPDRKWNYEQGLMLVACWSCGGIRR